MKIISSEKKPIKMWLNDIESGALEQAQNLANLPFIYKHVALMPDCHQGYGMPIGGVIGTIGAVIPNAVGVDIGCGMCAVKTALTEIDTDTVKKIMQDITYLGAINEGLKKDWDGTHYWYSFPEGYKEKYTGYTATKRPVYAFRILWNSINEKRGYGWDLNPYVWVIKYKRIEK